MAFKYIDLFAGIGGFHGALSALGGECVFASEIDRDAARIYLRNWGLMPEGDITKLANDTTMEVPPHDVLVGGFPCQPFSKSGKQLGMEEARGTLFWNIAKIIEYHRPKVVLLENVRNLAGPRHKHEWDVIISTLREFGYRVSSIPLVVTPHKIHPQYGGSPQVRERIFIAATYGDLDSKQVKLEPKPLNIDLLYEGWNPQDWNLKKHLPLEQIKSKKELSELTLTDSEIRWIDAWDDFVVTLRDKLGGGNLPGFPIWVDSWIETKKLKVPPGTPDWKENFLRKNAEFYTLHKKDLDKWLKRWDALKDFPPSRRKLEWQAQDNKTLWESLMHFRPSGIRAKKTSYVPALVAITQTSIYGPQKRKLSVREAARLQGFPDWFDFIGQPDSISYRQLGNAVNIAVVYNVLKSLVIRDLDLLKHDSQFTREILESPANPQSILQDYSKIVSGVRTTVKSKNSQKHLRIVGE